LLDEKQANVGVGAEIGVSNDRVGRAEVDAD